MSLKFIEYMGCNTEKLTNDLQLCTNNKQDDKQSKPKSNLIIILLIIIYWFLRITNKIYSIFFQFSHSVVSDSLRPHESQHTRPPCPSPTPGVHSISCPSSQRCHAAISSSVIPFSSCPQSLPASRKENYDQPR